ncbi:hypothetical protein JCM8208_003928 [Rhodotorula glutinis]
MDAQPSAPRTHPLRPYSTSPSLDDWSLPAGAGAPPTASSSSSLPSARTSTGTAVPPSLRIPPPTDRYGRADGLLGVPSAGDGGPGAGSAGAAAQAGAMLRAFVTSSLLSFTGVALVQPFEVGKTLAQVQWVPRGEEAAELGWDAADNVADEVVEIEDEGDAEAYFEDLRAASGPSFQPPGGSFLAPPRPTSPGGYLTRGGVVGADSALGTRPEWIMPIVVQGGVWDMIKAVGRWKGEGWASLWKGQLTTCVLDSLTTAIQPFFLAAMTAALLPSSSFSALPLIYAPKPGPLLILTTLSHTVTTFLLSPLDLVRTRLIVQSAQPQHRKYKGPWHALRTIVEEEGGLWTTYFHPNLLFPALLEGVVRPLIHLSTPLVISRYLHIEPSSSPLTFGLAELVLGTVGLLVTLPLETVRKRLQLQSRAAFVRAGRAGGVGRAWRTCVETRPQPYAGVVEAVYRILTEETGKIPRRRRRRRSSAAPGTPGLGGAPSPGLSVPIDDDKEDLATAGLGASGGLRQLYRGFGMGVGANAVVFLLALIAGGEEASGWAEM